MAALKFTPGHVRLDVKEGRDLLKKVIERGKSVQITANITIDTVWSHDDGISREFSGDVTSFTILEN